MAMAAGADQRDHDMIAALQPGDAGSDGLDDSGRLMAIDSRQVAAPGALHVVDVAVADGAGRELDLDLARAGLGDVDLLDQQGLAELATDGGFHGRSFVGGVAWRRKIGCTTFVRASTGSA